MVAVSMGVGVSGTGVVGLLVGMVMVEAGGWGGTFSPVQPERRIEQIRVPAMNRERSPGLATISSLSP
jgi:hypothetical protein